MSWQRETDQILSALFQEIYRAKAANHHAVQNVIRKLGKNKTYLNTWQRRWKSGQRTGFDLGIIMQILDALEIDAGEFFRGIYGALPRSGHSKALLLENIKLEKLSLPSEISQILTD